MRISPEQRDFLLALIKDPPAGSRIEAAKKFGIDLTLNLRNLELTFKERLRELDSYQSAAEKLQTSKLMSDFERLSAKKSD